MKPRVTDGMIRGVMNPSIDPTSTALAVADGTKTIPHPQKKTPPVTAKPVSGQSLSTPSIYDFTDYREYLKAFFDAKKAANPAYSAAAFTRRAGLGANSRGYLKLVIDGKRGLTPKTIRAFGEALGLSLEDSIYFENLVLFNQSESPKDRKHYFERLLATQPKKKSRQMELLDAQYRYFNHWYIMAVRELIATTRFDERPYAIAKALKNRITANEAAESISTLLKLELIARDETGRLVQTSPILNIPGKIFSPFIVNYHLGMIEQARHSIKEEDFKERSASGVTLSCPRSKLSEIRAEIDSFRTRITEKYGVSSDDADSVLQMNIQLFQLTDPSTLKGENK